MKFASQVNFSSHVGFLFSMQPCFVAFFQRGLCFQNCSQLSQTLPLSYQLTFCSILNIQLFPKYHGIFTGSIFHLKKVESLFIPKINFSSVEILAWDYTIPDAPPRSVQDSSFLDSYITSLVAFCIGILNSLRRNGVDVYDNY